MPARRLLADAYEQLGYQAESTSVRNSYLQGAYRTAQRPARRRAAALYRSGRGARHVDREVAGLPGHQHGSEEGRRLAFTINLVTPDNGEKYLVELSNATLTNIKGQQAKNPDLTITLNRADLNQVMMGSASFDDLIKAGKAKFDGDRKPFDQLRGDAGAVHAGLRDPAGHGAEEAHAAAQAVRGARPREPDEQRLMLRIPAGGRTAAPRH